eukprot:4792674-Amphidinium_carterae.1
MPSFARARALKNTNPHAENLCSTLPYAHCMFSEATPSQAATKLFNIENPVTAAKWPPLEDSFEQAAQEHSLPQNEAHGPEK